jgi:hypothetical protein
MTLMLNVTIKSIMLNVAVLAVYKTILLSTTLNKMRHSA